MVKMWQLWVGSHTKQSLDMLLVPDWRMCKQGFSMYERKPLV
jgi:hypothetical protein